MAPSGDYECIDIL